MADISPLHIDNLELFDSQTDWQDGEVLEELVTSSGRDLPIIDEDTPVEKIKKCINVGRFLGVEPILTAEEITEENKEHLGIMTYAAQFLPHNSQNIMNTSSTQYRSSSPPPIQFRSLSPNPGHFRSISPNPGNYRSASPPPVQFRSLSPNPGHHRSRSPPDYKPVLSNTGGYKTIVPINPEPPSSSSHYSQNSMYRSTQTYSQQQTINNFHDISMSKYSRKVTFQEEEVTDGKGTSSQSYSMSRSIGGSQEPQISVFDDDSNYSTRTSSLMTNSIQPQSHHSNHFNNSNHGNFSMVRHTETNSLEFAPETYKIDCYSVGVIFETKITRPFDPDKVRVEAVAPNGRVVKVTGDGHYSAQFTHTEIGEWRVSLYYKDRYLDGCAMDICDPSQVRVLGLKGGIVGQRQEFKIDASKGGDGEIAADIKHNGRQVITNLSKIEPGVYRVSYTPYDPGPYSIDVTFNGAEVRESDTNPSDPEERQRKAVFYTELKEAENDKIKIKTSCDWEIDYMTGGPFICHVTDGSDIQVYGMNDGTICATPQLIVDCSKGPGGHLHVEVVCNNRVYTAKMTEERPNVYRVTFKPSGPGVYKIHLTYNGSPVKGSPFIQEIDELELPMAQGEGLLRGLPNQPSTFIVDPRGVQGPVSVNVIGPRHPVKSYIETQSNGTYKVYYTAVEKGQHNIDVRVDNKPLEGSPFKPWVVDPVLVRVSGGWRSFVNDGGFIPLVVNKEKHIPFDASEAGPGELTAEVRGPTGKIPVAIDARNDGRNTVIFTPRAEGHHDIDVFWGGFQLRNSPYPGWATYRSDVDIDRLNIGPPPVRYAYTRSPPPSDIGSVRSDYPLVSVHGSEMDIYAKPIKHPNMVQVLPNGAPPNKVMTRGPLKVILRGKGLKEAFIDKEAQFYIDGTQCNDGIPEAKMSSQKASIPIKIEKHGPRVYRCTYVPKVPGAYLLYIKWDNQPLRGSPFKINVKGQHKAHRVRFVVDDVKKTRVGKDVDIHIDTRDAGPGELITKVISPDGNLMEHRVLNNPDGTRRLTFLPKMIGRHIVDILYDDVHIHGSPYYIDIEATLPSGEVRVWGPGIESGILGAFQSHFWCEADGAGAGELRVKIMGPKGAFHVKMRKAKKHGKLYQCFYNPIEAGIYTVYVMWSGQHIEGSPFTVLLAADQEELERFQTSPEAQRYPAVDDNGDVLY
ncbi:hypothetical protein LOTGIDRAFT_229996 [Lottia gigantea]|uniref:Calponin-homology (CH) domain-containing protein n=1 Tax=Lottia gigantea TaxID=225164 RepID=V4B3J0_LOTGI|nr:hypothetical protein LOTGIDRAFT_229996 [Lottia gigantea]ESP04923.1 hypothetical protein LOTGIDRAFT_229996 [Lottia gigantea]